jgi:hypothetical protein
MKLDAERASQCLEGVIAGSPQVDWRWYTEVCLEFVSRLGMQWSMVYQPIILNAAEYILLQLA